MRPPSKQNALENGTSPVSRDPSYPDRARIDSDVRAFLRPASSPWIVFDRDSRVDDFAKSALRLGAVFASNPGFRPSVIPVAEAAPAMAEAAPAMAEAAPSTAEAAPPRSDAFRDGALLASAMSSLLPSTGVFPSSAPSPESGVEPSSLVVSSDVVPSSSYIPASLGEDRPSDAPAPLLVPPARAARRRGARLLGAALAVVAVAVSVTAIGARSSAKHAEAARVAEPSTVAAATAPAEVARAEETPAPSPAAEPPAPEPAEAAEAPKAAKAPTDPKRRFGRLTIRGAAKHKNVYFDGKRMLGSGHRSFRVFCGMHTIAVTDKADAKDIEVPCNGEYLVSR